jgi:pimeloyl-ACP methyl ester carboxylesterase
MTDALAGSTSYRTTMVDGLSIFYREAGAKDAPTILLLHGFPSSSHMFRDLIPALADEFHLVAPDYPGFGNSDAPPLDRFAYSFDRLADVIEHFVQQLGLRRFAIYVQDFGGPVGFRLATRHPEWISAIIVQNANAYPEGLSKELDRLLRPVWEHRSPETEAPVLKLFEREGTIFQYKTGARDFSAMNPDAWNVDQYGLDRPGNVAIQLELQATYHTNLKRYPEWHTYFAKHQPPTLVVWGKGDPVFTVEGAKAYQRDLKNIEMHLLDTGHFALEEEHATIAAYIQQFFRKKGIC